MTAESKEEHRIKVICGLGNPGPEYMKTRHNCGFMVLEHLAGRFGGRWQKTKFKADCCRAVIGGQRLYLLKPLTYMNNSGEALRAFLDYYRLKPEDVLLIYDDVDVELGSIRIREHGSAGSHNGMRSAIREIGSKTFPRIPVGIAPQPERMDSVDHGLGAIPGPEGQVLEEAIEDAASAAAVIAGGDIQKAMNTYNSRKGSHANGEH